MKYNLISWNVNGLRAVHRKDALKWLAPSGTDVFCIQETKAHPEQLPKEINPIPGYEVYFSSAEKKGYSGVGIYTKPPVINVEHGFGHPEFDNEGRTVMAEYEHFYLFNVYFPNGKASKDRLDYKMRFYKAFQEHVTQLRSKGKGVVICGDVNTAHHPIDLARPKANEKVSGFLPIEREWIDGLLASGFSDSLRMFNDKPEQYTWWDVKTRARERNVGWRIDYFYVSDEIKDKISHAAIHADIIGSDHCPISCQLVF